MLRTVLLVVVALIIGAALTVGGLFALGLIGSGPKEETTSSSAKAPVQKNEPPANKGPATATVRISGTQGVIYFGSYGSTAAGRKSVEGTLGAEPIDDEVPLEQTAFETLSVSLHKRASSPPGRLRVQIIADGEVAKDQETEAESGDVSVDYSPLKGS